MKSCQQQYQKRRKTQKSKNSDIDDSIPSLLFIEHSFNDRPTTMRSFLKAPNPP